MDLDILLSCKKICSDCWVGCAPTKYSTELFNLAADWSRLVCQDVLDYSFSRQVKTVVGL